jgi:hypothetical protein
VSESLFHAWIFQRPIVKNILSIITEPSMRVELIARRAGVGKFDGFCHFREGFSFLIFPTGNLPGAPCIADEQILIELDAMEGKAKGHATKTLSGEFAAYYSGGNNAETRADLLKVLRKTTWAKSLVATHGHLGRVGNGVEGTGVPEQSSRFSPTHSEDDEHRNNAEVPEGNQGNDDDDEEDGDDHGEEEGDEEKVGH